MRTIKKNEAGEKLIYFLDEAYPVDEDIGIIDDAGEVLGVVIPKKAYDFFLLKIEEEEDRIDAQTANDFQR